MTKALGRRDFDYHQPRVPQPWPSQVRTAGLVLVLGTMAVAILATQWPFEYRATPFAVRVRWNRIDWSWFPRTHTGEIHFSRDFALNLVMLMPLGVGFALWRRAAAVRVFVESLALGVTFSATLELAQLATRTRYTSFPDLWRNALGCAVACGVVLALRRCTRRSRQTPA